MNDSLFSSVDKFIIIDGKPYVSFDSYKSLKEKLEKAQGIAESLFQQLVNVRVAEDCRKNMKIV